MSRGATSPESILDEHAEDLAAATDPAVVNRARETLDEWRMHHYGFNPRGGVAAAVYEATLVEDADLRQADVSELFGVSAATLRKRFHELAEFRD